MDHWDHESKTNSASKSAGIRGWINQNSPTVTVGAIAVLVLSMFLISQYPRRRSPDDVVRVYFYDSITKEYFVDDARKLPPIESPSGNEAVRAYFYTCGECEDEEKFLGYYEKYTPEAIRALQSTRKNYDSWMLFEEMRHGQLLSTDGQEWVSAWSKEGDNVIQELYTRCKLDGGGLRPCPPSD